jgi:UDP-glucose 4-epimerase
MMTEMLHHDRSWMELSEFYHGRTIAVTGGASFIGSHLVELLVALGAKVTVGDDLSSGREEHLEHLRSTIRFVKGDLRNAAVATEALAGADVVFHLAAQHGGRGYIETHPVECMNNMVLDHSVFAAAVASGARKIVLASSACVYPTTLQASATDRRLLSEDDANFETQGKAFADGAYGWAKLMAELQLRAFCEQFGVSGVACRLFTAYGERENESHAVVALIAKAAARLDPFPIWGDGTQTRNFTYVQDTVMGMATAAARMNGFAVINVGSSTHHTILELIEEIFAAGAWRPTEIMKQMDKPVGVLSRASDNSRCRELLHWEPRTPLAVGVRKTMAWYRSRATTTSPAELERLLTERS